jgi:hypothetical protein
MEPTSFYLWPVFSMEPLQLFISNMLLAKRTRNRCLVLGRCKRYFSSPQHSDRS